MDVIYKRGAIYKIPCKDCSDVYTGETGRCFNTRLFEHKRDLKRINFAKLKEDDLNKKTALVKHCFICERRIDFGNFEILNYNIGYDKRKFLESLYINSTKNSINDKDWNVFPKIYSNIKNLTMNMGFHSVKFVSVHEVVIKLLCMFASHLVLISLFFKFLFFKYVVHCVLFLPDESDRCNRRNVALSFSLINI